MTILRQNKISLDLSSARITLTSPAFINHNTSFTYNVLLQCTIIMTGPLA